MLRNAASDAAMGETSVADFPFFFSAGLFGVLHRPSCAADSGWVICNPFGMERTNAHRLGFEWARALAGAGHWVLRFDYRGTGDSAGSFESFTIHDYVEDIAQAVAELQRLSGVSCRGLVGLRLGAGLAATFAAGSGRELDLVMWEPVVDGRKYRDALLRTAMANELVNSDGPHKSRDDFRRELAAGRPVSVDGFALTAPMHDSLATLDLTALGRPTPAPVFVVQIDSRPGRAPRPATAKLVRAYSAGGAVGLERVQAPSVWLRTKSYRWRQGELFEKTLDWIEGSRPRLSKTSAPVTVETGSNQTGRSIERPVGFEVAGERVWGILHDPHEPRENAPNIVLIAAGAICRSGVFYPRLARDLASAGWRVLRFDPLGMGDSDGHFDCDSVDEVYARVEAGALVPDAVAAFDFLERECGSGKSVLTGLCGGAITSVFTAAADDRVVGIAPLDMPLKLTLPVTTSGIPPRSQRVLWVDVFSQRRGTFFLLTVRRLLHAAKGAGRLLRPKLARVFNLRSGYAPGEEGWFREQFGEDVNLAMLAAFRGVLDRKIPVCCIFADTEEPLLFESALTGLLKRGKDGAPLLEYSVLSGSEHTFTMPGQTEELSHTLMKWLDDPRMPWAGEN